MKSGRSKPNSPLDSNRITEMITSDSHDFKFANNKSFNFRSIIFTECTLPNFILLFFIGLASHFCPSFLQLSKSSYTCELHGGPGICHPVLPRHVPQPVHLLQHERPESSIEGRVVRSPLLLTSDIHVGSGSTSRGTRTRSCTSRW